MKNIMNFKYLILGITCISIGIIGMLKNQFWKYETTDSSNFFRVRMFGSFAVLIIIGIFLVLNI